MYYLYNVFQAERFPKGAEISMDCFEYCQNIVKEHDKDRFLLALTARGTRREALFALFAFNHEIAKTREIVSETTIGLIRLQWWRDALTAIYEGGEPPKNLIVEALQKTIKIYDLPPEHFETLILGREFDLENVLPANMEGVMTYVDYAALPLTKLCMIVLGDDYNDSAENITRTYALSGILRATPYFTAQGRCYLPADLMQAHNIMPEALYRDGNADGLETVIQAVWNKAQGFAADKARTNKMLGSMRVIAQYHLKAIKKADFDIYSPRINVKSPIFYVKLLLSN